VIEKDKEIAKVADFRELHVKLVLKGENLPDVRVNQLAKIEVRAEQPPTRILRGDREGFLWRAERVQFNKLIDDPIKNWLRDELQKQPVTRDDGKDIPLDVAEVESIKVDAKLSTTALDPATAAVAGDRLRPDSLHLMELRGRVAEAKHTGKLTLNDFPPAVTEGLRERLLAQVQGKVVEEARPFRIDGFRSMAVFANVKVETTEPPADEETRREQIRQALPGSRVERFVEATIVLDDPPPDLTRAVEAQYKKEKPSGPRVDVDVVTARRRFAMLLFRQ
jgi:hypothetical protein